MSAETFHRPTQHPLAHYKHAVFHTKNFWIRPMCREDQMLMYSWRTAAHTTRYLTAPPPSSVDQQMQWFDEAQHQSTTCYYLIEAREDEPGPIGYISYVTRDNDLRAAEAGLVLGERTKLGMGRILGPLLCKCAFGLIGLQKLYANIQVENIAATRLLHQLDAVMVEGAHPYRKHGEVLYRIEATRFKAVERRLVEQAPHWRENLTVVADFCEDEMR